MENDIAEKVNPSFLGHTEYHKFVSKVCQTHGEGSQENMYPHHLNMAYILCKQAPRISKKQPALLPQRDKPLHDKKHKNALVGLHIYFGYNRHDQCNCWQ